MRAIGEGRQAKSRFPDATEMTPLTNSHDESTDDQFTLQYTTEFEHLVVFVYPGLSEDTRLLYDMPIGSANSTQSRRATPRYVTFLSTGRWPCHPISWHATPRTSVHPSQTPKSWRVRVDYIQSTTTSSYSSVTRHCRQQGLTNPTLWGELLAC